MKDRSILNIFLYKTYLYLCTFVSFCWGYIEMFTKRQMCLSLLFYALQKNIDVIHNTFGCTVTFYTLAYFSIYFNIGILHCNNCFYSYHEMYNLHNMMKHEVPFWLYIVSLYSFITLGKKVTNPIEKQSLAIFLGVEILSHCPFYCHFYMVHTIVYFRYVLLDSRRA